MRRLACLTAALLLAIAATPGRAANRERVDELWRSRYGTMPTGGSLVPAALNPADSSLWLIEGANVTHLAADGSLLFRSPPLHSPRAVAVDRANGSCWVLQALSDEVVHFAADGALLSATPGYSSFHSLSPSPADGSLWLEAPSHLAHVDITGREVWRGQDWRLLEVDPGDGSAWLTDPSTQEIVRVRADGSEMWRSPGLAGACVADEDLRDQSLWIAWNLARRLRHLSSDGELLWEAAAERSIRPLHVSPIDGSVWLTYYSYNYRTPFGDSEPPELVHLDSSGQERWRRADTSLTSYSYSDGSAWALTFDPLAGRLLVHLSADNQELHRLPYPDRVLAYDPGDSSLWAADLASRRLLRLSPDGAVLWEDRLQALGQLWASDHWVDHRDGSCWAVDDRSTAGQPDELVHLAADGAELERRRLADPSLTVQAMSLSPVDGSWWVLATAPGDDTWTPSTRWLLHLADDGFELWRREGVRGFLAIDARDGSAWTSHTEMISSGVDWEWSARAYHFAPDGTQIWAGEFPHRLGPLAPASDGSVWAAAGDAASSWLTRISPAGEILAEIPLDEGLRGISDLAVLPSDGSIYAVTERTPTGRIYRIASDGALMWLREGVLGPARLALDPANGTVWVTDAGGWHSPFSGSSAVVHLAPDGAELWRGDTFNLPKAIDLDPGDGTVWVSDNQHGQLVHLQGVFSLFADAGYDHWAVEAIVACHEAGIVFGYGNRTYQPSLAVTRDQMAAYIARALAGGDPNVPTGPTTVSFGDVPPSHWAHRYVEYCHDRGVVEGYWDGYHPDEPVDRAQMAVYVARAVAGGDADIPEAEGWIPPFWDVPPGHWAHRYIAYCRNRGIVRGYWDGYHPDEPVDRAQMAVYVQRAFDLPT